MEADPKRQNSIGTISGNCSAKLHATFNNLNLCKINQKLWRAPCWLLCNLPQRTPAPTNPIWSNMQSTKYRPTGKSTSSNATGLARVALMGPFWTTHELHCPAVQHVNECWHTTRGDIYSTIIEPNKVYALRSIRATYDPSRA